MIDTHDKHLEAGIFSLAPSVIRSLGVSNPLSKYVAKRSGLGKCARAVTRIVICSSLSQPPLHHFTNPEGPEPPFTPVPRELYDLRDILYGLLPITPF